MIEVKGYDTNVIIYPPDEIAPHSTKTSLFFFNKKIIPDLDKTQCFISPDQKLAFFGIYKNASTFINTNLEEIGWERGHINLRRMPTIFTVLRDPYERWISGFVQDVKDKYDSKTKSNETLEMLTKDIKDNSSSILDFLFTFKLFTYGPATELQSQYPLGSIPTNKIVFFNQGSNLNFKLHHWLFGEGIENNFLNAKPLNINSNSELYLKILCYLSDGKNHQAKSKLLEHLEPDFQLLKSVNFI